ncbi:MAG: response regulator, partial [Gammaproteobacteria bacterium]
LALLDIHMPGEDGLSLARYLREHYRMAIVILTSAGTVVDRIVGLEMGADDYIPKPFDPRELLARIKSVLRRTSFSALAELGAERIRFGRCVLDLSAHRLTDEKGKEVPMSPLEFDLLHAFSTHPNQVLSRERILNLSTQRDLDPFERCSGSPGISLYTPVARLILETRPCGACAPFRSRRNGPALRRNATFLRSRRFFTSPERLGVVPSSKRVRSTPTANHAAVTHAKRSRHDPYVCAVGPQSRWVWG